jgi:hypothetical protein
MWHIYLNHLYILMTAGISKPFITSRRGRREIWVGGSLSSVQAKIKKFSDFAMPHKVAYLSNIYFAAISKGVR